MGPASSRTPALGGVVVVPVVVVVVCPFAMDLVSCMNLTSTDADGFRHGSFESFEHFQAAPSFAVHCTCI